MNPKEKLQAILDAANNTTAAADTDITMAVRSLIDGYGQGGFALTLLPASSGTTVILPDNGRLIIPDVFPEKPFKIDNVYVGVSGITYIYIGSGWRRTVERAGQFRSCNDLEKVVLGMPETSYDMFWDCTKLKSVELLESVETIAGYLVESCTALEEIVIFGETVKTLSAATILNGANANAKIYVPDNLVSAYKSATNWNAYASRILPMSSRPV